MDEIQEQQKNDDLLIKLDSMLNCFHQLYQFYADMDDKTNQLTKMIKQLRQNDEEAEEDNKLSADELVSLDRLERIQDVVLNNSWKTEETLTDLVVCLSQMAYYIDPCDKYNI